MMHLQNCVLAKLLMDNSFQIINLDAPVGQRGKDF